MANLQNSSNQNTKKVSKINPLKILFAMEYMMQGIANPFFGITYQPFFKHFRFDYGLSEAATQTLFSRSYLAWSFKPVIGFLIDSYGKTKVILLFLLLSGALIYALTPILDISVMFFFWMMFACAILFASTDVAVDRATVISGEEEAKRSGRSRAATIGINQAICWAAIYGAGIIAASTGGLIADKVPIKYLLFALAFIPIIVLLVVLRLPKDKEKPIPLQRSISNFWNGLNTGPILWIVLFYFLFHFEPLSIKTPLWNNYLIVKHRFTQTQIGYAEGISYAGYFLGVLLFVWLGIKWQDKLGFRKLFKIFIISNIAIKFSHYLMIDPVFTNISSVIHSTLFPFADFNLIRLGFFAAYSFIYSLLLSFIRMSTFSLVGAVIPVNAAGSLFAGFMSVANIAYSFSLATGSWLYTNGMNFTFFQSIQRGIFGITGNPGDKMSFALLILISAITCLPGFAVVHMLPDKQQSQAIEESYKFHIGPLHFKKLGSSFLKIININACLLAVAILYVTKFVLNIDIAASIIVTFFLTTFLRKAFLDWRYKNYFKSD